MSFENIKQQVSQLITEGKLQQAQKILLSAPSSAESDPDYWFLLAGINGMQGKYEIAKGNCEHALDINPDHALANFRLANSLAALNQNQDAIIYYDKALQQLGSSAHIWNNKGVSLMSLSQPAKAEGCYRKALELDPAISEFKINIAISLDAQNLMNEAIKLLEEVLSHSPENIEANWTLANSYLALGEFKKGWSSYHYRWQRPGKERPALKGLVWNGESLSGKTILIYSEQGFGDTIQFVRFVSLLKSKYNVSRILFECHAALTSLFSTLSEMECISFDDINETLEYDTHCSVADLPAILISEESDIPTAIPYLDASACSSNIKGVIETKIKESPTKPSIGIVWAGNPNQANDHNRSCSLEYLEPLFELTGINWFSLQKDQVEANQHDALARLQVTDLAPSLNSYCDTAIAIENLDLIISVDTSVAHLAGALGKRCWVMLPYCAGWRWMIDRTDSPWYPKSHLYRQKEIANWTAVIDEVKNDLINRYDIK